MTTITIKNLVLSKPEGALVANNDGYYMIKFEFDEEWDGHLKIVRFLTNVGYKDVVLDEECVCKVPGEVLRNPGKIRVGVYSDKLASGLVDINVVESVITATRGEALVEDVPKQVLSKLAGYATICNNILNECRAIHKEVLGE
jgi:hypothetical protein